MLLTSLGNIESYSVFDIYDHFKCYDSCNALTTLLGITRKSNLRKIFIRSR